jgi:GT2 family glycosyltransferase
VVGSTVVARRQALIETGLFDESFVHGEDFDLWSRLAYRGGRIDYRKRIHTRRRIHEANLTADFIGSFQGQSKVLRKLMNELDLPDSLRNKMQREAEKCDAAVALEKCKRHLVARRYDEAISELKLANAACPSFKLQLVLYLLRTVPDLVRHLYLKTKVNEAGLNIKSIAILLNGVGL